jgi:hypothetical protein
METTRTLKASGAVPWKTVRASPSMPGFTCESGKIAAGPSAATAGHASKSASPGSQGGER